MKYGVIGEHLKHSFSKEIHSIIGDYQYEIKEIEPDKLEEFMQKRDFLGINVTIPYKEKVIPMLDYVDPQAKKIGAVNTVVNREGKLYGYNTDYAGMKALIERTGIEVKNKKILIIGTGGTSKTATSVLTDMGAAELIYVSARPVEGAFTYDEIYKSHTDVELIFNTSPVGMFPNNHTVAVDLSAFKRLEGVLDVVYNPLKTKLVQKATELGVRTCGGLYMLGAQAIYASEHFFGNTAPSSLFERVYKAVLSKKNNISLIGMPSSGKSTVGKLLAEMTGKELVDTDTLIKEKIGMEITDYFRQHGEERFRELESQVIEDVSKMSNLVIATGGGAVLNPENVRKLKQNGCVYFLDRSLDNLVCTNDRPLSSNRADLEKRYNERYGIYMSSCDKRIDGNDSPEAVARLIYEEYNK